MIFEIMTEQVAPLVQKILTHPFNDELAKGTLPQQTFIGYLQQDALYLRDFSKALALVAARLPAHFSANVLKLALGAVEAAQRLHQRYLEIESSSSIVEQNPACFMYTHYLLSTASLGAIEEAIASLVPCFWIYQIVGRHIAATQAEPNPFHAWINTYSSESFELAVSSIVDLMNTLAASASTQNQQQMLRAFKCATELEWLFWEDAYCETPSFFQRVIE